MYNIILVYLYIHIYSLILMLIFLYIYLFNLLYHKINPINFQLLKPIQFIQI